MSELSPAEREALHAQALAVRAHVVRMATAGGCFIGASLSCADVLTHLYARVLRVSPERRDDPDRDHFFLSKGHDVPALYGVLAERGFFPRERLGRHLSIEDHLYWHPNRAIPGVEFHSGSLGHLLSVAMGVAEDLRLRGSPGRAFVLLGDGELNEGSVWEALLVASARRLDNLVVVVDRNGFQANVETESLIPLEPLAPRFAAFGCDVQRVDGHDFDALEQAFARIAPGAGKPAVVIADTVRGKGLPSIERRADRWFVNFSADEVEQLLRELHQGETATLRSSPLMVR